LCGFESIDLFLLEAKKSKTKAAGAGVTGMEIQISSNNQLQLGRWKIFNSEIILLDLSHVNEALAQHKSKKVHGIIGADVLLKGKAIIDYYNCCLYLR